MRIGNKLKILILSFFVALISLASLFIVVKAGSLTPPGQVGATMHSLQELYDTLAGTFNSSSQNASATGNIIQQLKYISNNLFWTQSGNNISNSNSGNVGIGTTSPSAYLTIKAGTTAVGTAPLKFTVGANLAIPETGAMEFDGNHLYFTDDNAAPVRYQLAELNTVNNAKLCTYDSATGHLNCDTDSASVGHSPLTITAVGTAPNASGLSLDGSQALTLQPADATNPGAVTIGAQTFAGAKTFTGSTTLASTAGNTFTIGNSAGVGTIASGGTSSWINTSGNLTISTATSGALALTSTGALNLSAGAASIWTLPNVANALNFDSDTLTIDALNNSVGIGTTSLSGARFKIALDSSSVSDGYDNQSKIASLTNAAVSAGKLQISEAVCGIYTVQDVDSNSYNTVLIGTQCWLKQNLRTGTKITSCTNGYVGVCTTGGDTVQNQTNNSIIEKYCYSDTDANCTTDGGLYQWAEAMQYKDGCSNTTSLQPTEPVQGICPTGWHIPTDAQQYTLENYLKDGANSCVSARTGWDCDTAGTKLKVGGASGFEGVLAGYRNTDGSFYNRFTNAYLWSSSQYDASVAWRRLLYSGYSTVYRYYYNKAHGFSVRCLKD